MKELRLLLLFVAVPLCGLALASPALGSTASLSVGPAAGDLLAGGDLGMSWPQGPSPQRDAFQRTHATVAGSALSAAVRQRLNAAAGDEALEPWQQRFMMRVAQRQLSRSGDLRGVSSGTPVPMLATETEGEWTLETPPVAAGNHTAIYDPVRDRMVVFGGYGGGPLNDVWALSLAGTPAWTEVTPAGTPPAARWGHTAIYDPVRDRMVVFGGGDGYVGFIDVWALSLAGTPAWTEVTPTGTPPAGQFDHTAIYDPVRDRMVVFGGGHSNAVWALSLAGPPVWTEVTPSGTPPAARGGHTAVYDPVRDRMVVFGGEEFGTLFSDVWTLSLAGTPAWIEVTPTGTPPAARDYHTAIYDPVRDRIMVVFGGGDGYVGFNDVWALSLAGTPTWTEITPTGTPPVARGGHSAIYDPVRDRMVVFGGEEFGTLFSDVWTLSLAGPPVWTEVTPSGTPPAAREGHTAVYDPVRDRMVVFGGDGMAKLSDVWALSWGTTVSAPPGDSGLLSEQMQLSPPRPNPSRGQVTLDFTLPRAGQVSLTVYDMAGRLVAKLIAGPLAAGRHSVVWDSGDRTGRRVAAGTYFVRLATSHGGTVRKVILLHSPGALE